MAWPLGDAPKIDWLEGTTLHTAEGGTVTLDAAYFQVVPYDDGWLALGSTNSGYSATVLDSEGTPVGEPFATGEGLAISDDGTRVLYVDDGDLLVHVNGGDTEVLLEGVGNNTEPIGFSRDSALYNVQRGNGENDGRSDRGRRARARPRAGRDIHLHRLHRRRLVGGSHDGDQRRQLQPDDRTARGHRRRDVRLHARLVLARRRERPGRPGLQEWLRRWSPGRGPP